MTKEEQIKQLEENWANDQRWQGIERPYSAEDVVRLRRAMPFEHTIAKLGAESIWKLLKEENYVSTLGAISDKQALQQVQAGLKAICLNGWQVPTDIKSINQAFQQANDIQHVQDGHFITPIISEAEAGFDGQLNAFELMKDMIEAGASGVHFDDQLASEKKCGPLGSKVLLPTQHAIHDLVSARLAADVLGVPTLVLARTIANSADLITSDIDPNDHDFITGERAPEGYYRTKPGLDQAIGRGLSYAPYADLIWYESSEPNLAEAQAFADAIHAQFPNKMLAYNCPLSIKWIRQLNTKPIEQFQAEIAMMGYKFQFVSLAGSHLLNHSMYELAYRYKQKGMGVSLAG